MLLVPMLELFYIILAIYAVFILGCLLAWLCNKSFIVQKKDSDISLSLVVCCKNEERQLPTLFASIEPQVGEIDEVIFVSDHSTDSTLTLLESFAQKHHKIMVFSSIGRGKKNALKEAVNKVQSLYVLCTDADCVVSPDYFSMVKSFLWQHKPDLMVGGVKYTDSAKLFGQMQALEFASLASTTAATALAGYPIMCNGANLAFSRDIWNKAQNHLVDSEASGDDMFLMHFVKRVKGKIVFLKHTEGFVETFAVDGLKQFFEQRKRWVSKSRSYTDGQTIFVALLVAVLNVCITISLFMAVFDIRFIGLFVIKFLLDSCLLMPFLCFSNQKKLIKFIPLISIIYPFYIVLTLLGGMFGRFDWKK